MAIIYGLKVNLSIAMVRMINQTAVAPPLAPGFLERQKLALNETNNKTWRQTLEDIQNEECTGSLDENNRNEVRNKFFPLLKFHKVNSCRMVHFYGQVQYKVFF